MPELGDTARGDALGPGYNPKNYYWYRKCPCGDSPDCKGTRWTARGSSYDSRLSAWCKPCGVLHKRRWKLTPKTIPGRGFD